MECLVRRMKLRARNSKGRALVLERGGIYKHLMREQVMRPKG